MRTEVKQRKTGIDKDKLRAKLRRMDDRRVYELLDRAIELLPPTKLRKLVEPYMRVEELVADGESPEDVLRTVNDFRRRSLNGDYYESFMVNSKNCMEMSKGTRAWIIDCHRFLDGCLKAVARGELKQANGAFEILFDLLAEIDRDPDAIIFFADEAGSWQVGCDWRRILPAWFKCLSATASPEDYAEKVVRIIDGFVHYDRDRHLTGAGRAASEGQREALRADILSHV